MKHRCRRLVVLFTVLAAAAGCSGAKQEYEGLCHLHERAAGPAVVTPAQQSEAMSAWIAENIKNTDVQRAIMAMGMERSSKRGDLLRSFAHDAGYDGPCPYADKMKADGLAQQAAGEAAAAAEAAAAQVAPALTADAGVPATP